MLVSPCPNCGAELRFRSTSLPVRVCDFCRSTVVRTGDALALAGKAAEVPADVSPLQIGTRGKDGGDAFELIGRVRWRWSGGAWSEWLMLFGDGGHGWLGEASGRLMLLRETGPLAPDDAIARTLKAGALPEVGTQATIAGVDYAVNDVRRVTCIGSEGELPFRAPAGLEAVSIDLMRGDGRCASVQIEGVQSDGDPPAAYAGRYVDLRDIAPANLRAIEGWPMPAFAT